MITIEAKVLGQRKRAFPEWSLPLPPEMAPGAGQATLRALITHVVRREARAFRERQEERRLLRVLTEVEIAAGAAVGKVDMGGHDPRQEVDEDTAVAAALQAFEDARYLVLIDGDQQESLGAAIALRPDSRVTFLRLVGLAGG